MKIKRRQVNISRQAKYWALVTGVFVLLSTRLQAAPSKAQLAHDRVWLRQKAEQLIAVGEKVVRKVWLDQYDGVHASPADEQAYFEAFPDCFAVLAGLYLYPKHPCLIREVLNSSAQYNIYDSGRLYRLTIEYIDAFFTLRSIEPGAFYNRLIDLSIDGIWDTNQLSGFRRKMITRVSSDLEGFCKVLAARSDGAIQGFWAAYLNIYHQPPYFSSDTYTGDDEEVCKLYEGLQCIEAFDGRVYRLLRAAWVQREAYRAWLRQRIEKLIAAGEKVIHRRYISPADEKAYFEAFPDSFALLDALFQNVRQGLEVVVKGLDRYRIYSAWDVLLNYFKAFFNLRTIDRDVFYNRLIDIGSQGEWEADYIHFFQGLFTIAVGKDLRHVCTLLAARSDQVIRSFWFFYLDEPHPDKELPKRLQGIKHIDERIYRLVQAAFKEVRRNACSGH